MARFEYFIEFFFHYDNRITTVNSKIHNSFYNTDSFDIQYDYDCFIDNHHDRDNIDYNICKDNENNENNNNHTNYDKNGDYNHNEHRKSDG